jgi:CheY-like chemotaxis protein/two-component sensor histidine kinase
MLINDKSGSLNHLAHDLNNLLTRILNSVELLKKKIKNYEEVASIISSIENGTFMTAEIIEDVLTETNQKVVRKKRINLNALITDLINTLGMTNKGNISLILNLEPKLQFVEGRYSDFYRIIMNLLINAIEAVENEGNILITTANYIADKKDSKDPEFFQHASYIELKIADDGVGIEPSLLKFIFDENFSTKNKNKNSGIGLSIVKKLIDEQNGLIKVTSEVNKGTEFKIILPSILLPDKKLSKVKKNILVAEDENVLRELLSELLTSYDFKVISVANGKEVLKEISKGEKPDLFLIDQKMPEMDGITCIKTLRDNSITAPIILASGSQSDDYNIYELNKTINKIITKPFNFEEILSVIKELI